MDAGLKTRPGLAVQAGTVPAIVRIAVEAERRGLPSFYSSELYDRSAVVTLAAVAAATARIRIGSSVAWAMGRTPVTVATDFRSLAELAPGRVALGLGTGNGQVIADWHGLEEPRPVARVAELVPLIRRIWEVGAAGVEHDGEFYRCHIPADPTLQPWPESQVDGVPDSRPRILVSGNRPPMIKAAGRVADGLIGPPLCSAALVDEMIRPALAEAAAQAGRAFPVPITGTVLCALAEDSAKARSFAATQVGVFAIRPSAAPLMALHGFGKEVAAIADAFARRDMAGLAAAVSDRMLDTLAVYGTPEEAVQRYAANFDGVYDETLLFTAGKGMPEGGFQESLMGTCEAFGD